MIILGGRLGPATLHRKDCLHSCRGPCSKLQSSALGEFRELQQAGAIPEQADISTMFGLLRQDTCFWCLLELYWCLLAAALRKTRGPACALASACGSTCQSLTGQLPGWIKISCHGNGSSPALPAAAAGAHSPARWHSPPSILQFPRWSPCRPGSGTLAVLLWKAPGQRAWTTLLHLCCCSLHATAETQPICKCVRAMQTEVPVLDYRGARLKWQLHCHSKSPGEQGCSST